MARIFPLNLTARLATEVAGNPASTRMEAGVANCFPGLEFDHRNLDRRFFPGLIFEFADSTATRSGARLLSVDTRDPDLSPLSFTDNPADKPDAAAQQALASALGGTVGQTLSEGGWFLDSITQGGKTISLLDAGTPFAGVTAWRIVRSLEPGPVVIRLTHRPGTGRQPIELTGWRRKFTNSDKGTISAAYQPGELTQSLCSPWMHDFRDCACFYWASNHPDIVMAEDLPGAPSLPDGSPMDPEKANVPIDWLRSDRSRQRTTPAEGTEEGNRPAQMDHYEINERWQDLDIVLRGREISRVFQPSLIETATPFATPDDLAANLAQLATLEHAVMLEYLYARYSVLLPTSGTPQPLSDDVTFVRHEMLLIAVSEMRHLRWVNQLLWELEHLNLLSKKVGPILDVATDVPGQNGKTRKRQLRPLTSDVLDDFIAVEQPSGTLDGMYARVLSTLRDNRTYNEDLAQLAERIIADGTQHFSRFRQIRVVLQPYFATPAPAFLLNISRAPASNSAAASAKAEYEVVLADLRAAYEKGDAEDFRNIASARTTMFALDAAANALAAQGFGVPFFV
jgi:hypothetical protein